MSCFSLWKMSSESEFFIGFVDGSSRHTQRLASTYWVIFTPQGQFLSSGGIYLGEATNNVIEYNVVLEFLHDTLSHGISQLRVYLDAHLVGSKLNGVYHLYNPALHQWFLRVHLLERIFYYITYIHVPRRLNKITYTLDNHVFNWHIAHM
jgi:ribonuclease HI